MFATSKQFAVKYNYLDAKFKTCYEFLKRGDLASLPVGKMPLDGGITVLVQEYTSKIPENCRFESHDKFFDIQYVVSGAEMFGLANRSELSEDGAYNPEKDITFYKEPAVCGMLLLNAGDFIAVAPEDAHKPGLMVAGKQAPVKKLVIKIPV